MALLALTAREAVAGAAAEQIGRHLQRVVHVLEASASDHPSPLRVVTSDIFDVAETVWRLRARLVAPAPFVRHLRTTQDDASAGRQQASR